MHYMIVDIRQVRVTSHQVSKGPMIDNRALCIHADGRVNYTLEEAIETEAIIRHRV